MDDVLAVLDREQRAMEHLLFRLQHARGVLMAADERFLGLAADELGLAAECVRELEACRAAMVDRGSPVTLRALAAAADEPHSTLLHEHRAALGRLAGEVGALIESTQELAEDRLAELRGGRPRYRRTRRRAVHVDDLDVALAAAGYESMLSASSSLRLPALVSFLA
jgi:hypothetical protein